MVKLSEFDASDYLDSPAAVSAYLTDALEVGQGDFIAKAVAVAIKALDRIDAIALDDIATQAGLERGLLP